MPRKSQFDLKKLAFGLVGGLAMSGCAMHRLKRDLRRKDLPAVQSASPKVRARLSPKWRWRYAELLEQRGQVQAARLWWLGSYLQGADLKALEALAVSYARRGEVGFAAALFAQILATERGALQNHALACEMWDQRKRARMRSGAFVSAQRDVRRLAALCGHPKHDEELSASAAADRMARSKTPTLIESFSPALMPVFLDPAWQASRLGRELDSKRVPTQGRSERRAGQRVSHSVAGTLIASPTRVLAFGPWLERAGQVRGPEAAQELLANIGQDPTLGPRAAGLTALLAASGHTRALAIVRDNLRASSSLQSAPSARLRVILAMVQGEREQAIFWMRLGASQVQDLGQWWLWCARWAQLTGQDAAVKVAYQALTKLVAPKSPARWALSWWRLLQRIKESVKDPYAQSDAPNTNAADSLRAYWVQFLTSLPQELVPGVWPALVDALVLDHWPDAQIHRLGVLLLGNQAPAGWKQQVLVSRAKLQLVRKHPEQGLELPSSRFRGEAWRELWVQSGIHDTSVSRYWAMMEQDPVWSPTVDPFAALSVLLSRPPRWTGQT